MNSGAASSSGRGAAGGGEADIVRMKIISMGEGAVGKSCLIKRYCEGKVRGSARDARARARRVAHPSFSHFGAQFVGRYISTIGIDFGVKPVTVGAGNAVRINFWDLSGHPEFFDVRNEFYKDTQGGILVYDVTSRSSFEALGNWIKEAAKFGGGDVPLVVCANKVRCVSNGVCRVQLLVDKRRQVTEAEGRAWAESRGFPYFETSAQSGANVNAVFAGLFETVLNRIKDKQ
eukprot:g570.t1